MPAHPLLGELIESLEDSIFSSFAGRLAAHTGPVYPLHIGDTWLEPAEGCRMEDLRVGHEPGLHRYTPTRGLPALVDAIAQRASTTHGVATEPANVLVTSGATAGLSAVMATLLDPGDEVLILAPHWPLIRGIVHCARGVPVPVPILGQPDSADQTVRLLEERRSSKTAAIYLSTPNNPTGRILPGDRVDAIVGWAADHDLWVVSDEVYEDHVFDGVHRHSRAAAPERTFSVHSFSKAYGMAGNRCGYVVGPSDAVAQIEKVTTHSVYCAPHASQLAALRVLGESGEAWLEKTRGLYLESGRRAAERLGVAPPQGGAFLFLDVAAQLGHRGLLGFLDACVERGLLVAPGPSFGPYPTHVRLCFTCAEPDTVQRGVELLARLLGR